MEYTLPKTVIVGGREYSIRSDYRAILDICEALTDPELSSEEKSAVWGQHRHRAAAQSRLLRALEEAAAQCTTGSLLARLRALLRAFCARINVRAA